MRLSALCFDFLFSFTPTALIVLFLFSAAACSFFRWKSSENPLWATSWSRTNSQRTGTGTVPAWGHVWQEEGIDSPCNILEKMPVRLNSHRDRHGEGFLCLTRDAFTLSERASRRTVFESTTYLKLPYQCIRRWFRKEGRDVTSSYSPKRRWNWYAAV